MIDYQREIKAYSFPCFGDGFATVLHPVCSSPDQEFIASADSVPGATRREQSGMTGWVVGRALQS